MRLLIRAILILLPLLLLPAAVVQQPLFPDLHVQKKSGQQSGPTLVTVNGKTKTLARHALEAWPIMDGQNAMVLDGGGVFAIGFQYGAGIICVRRGVYFLNSKSLR